MTNAERVAAYNKVYAEERRLKALRLKACKLNLPGVREMIDARIERLLATLRGI